jgi:hypothetical protein
MTEFAYVLVYLPACSAASVPCVRGGGFTDKIEIWDLARDERSMTPPPDREEKLPSDRDDKYVSARKLELV